MEIFSTWKLSLLYQALWPSNSTEEHRMPWSRDWIQQQQLWMWTRMMTLLRQKLPPPWLCSPPVLGSSTLTRLSSGLSAFTLQLMLQISANQPHQGLTIQSHNMGFVPISENISTVLYTREQVNASHLGKRKGKAVQVKKGEKWFLKSH